MRPGIGTTFIVIALMTFVGICIGGLRLGEVVEFGGDEGFEVAKAFLVSKGYRLYTDIWNDQPPLFTLMLSVLFSIVGPSILAARLVTLAFSCCLIVGVYTLVRKNSGVLAGLAASVLLVCSPLYVRLSVSVAQEIPAFALAVLSYAALVRCTASSRWRWLAVSAAIMAGALMIKFTAALILPALFVERLTRHPRSWRWTVAWGTMSVGTAVLLTMGVGGGGAEMLFRPHFGFAHAQGISRPSDFAPNLNMFFQHWEVWLTAAGTLVPIRRGQWKEVVFPLTLLAAVSLVHWVHRPWWPAYYLHHAIPLSWLAGIGVARALRWLRDWLRTGARSLRPCAIGATMVIGLVMTHSTVRLVRDILELRAATTLPRDPIFAAMSNYRTCNGWVYTQPTIYSFHAGCAIPPELAVLSLKRFWSGQMNWGTLLTTLQKYQPKLLLLRKSSMAPEWNRFLSSYHIVCEDDDKRLYVLSSLNKHQPERSNTVASAVEGLHTQAKVRTHDPN